MPHKETRQEEVPVDQALRLMKTTELITEEVKAGLAVELPGMSTPAPSVSEIAAMRPLTLASRLIGLPDVPEESLLDIARAIIASFRKMLDLDVAAATAPGPIQVTVVQDKKLSDMNVRELLTALAADPGQFDDIAAALAGTRQVQQAGQNPWALATAAGTLDVDATAEYLAYLSGPGSIPQRMWPPAVGRRPTTLGDIFGRDTLIMVNPFTGELFSGLDAWGNDWRKLPDSTYAHLAMMWAVASAPRHRNLPAGELNARQLTDDLFARRQPAYIREIIEDFTEARRRDPQLAAMSRYLTVAEASGLRLQASRAPGRGRTESDYRDMLLEAAQARRDLMSGSVHLGPVVIRSFSTMSASVSLDGTIVLGHSSTMSGSLHGTAYVPHGVTITTMSGGNHLAVYEESYERLARRAGLLA